MMTRRFSVNALSALLVGCLFLSSYAVSANGDMDPRQRLAIVKALKAKGTVGENNKGLLEFRGPKTAEKVVAAENAERTAEYQRVAAKTGATPARVAERRAAQLAEEAPSGAWIQKADGSWYRKP